MKTWGKHESTVYLLCIACGVLSPLGRVPADYTGPMVWGLASCLPNQFPFLLGFSWTTFPSRLWKEVWPYNEMLAKGKWAAVKPTTSKPAHGCQAGEPLCCFLPDCWPEVEDPGEDPEFLGSHQIEKAWVQQAPSHQPAAILFFMDKE